MGTSGGELLLSFKHPYQNTSVTEAYPPNIKLCQDKLTPLGITVYPILDDDKLINIGDNLFDIVLNHHESYDIKEIKRVLKDNGLFITQQVGAYNNYDLISYFDENYKIKFPDVTLDKAIKSLEENGFEIIYKNQYFSKNHLSGSFSIKCNLIMHSYLVHFLLSVTMHSFLVHFLLNVTMHSFLVHFLLSVTIHSFPFHILYLIYHTLFSHPLFFLYHKQIQYRPLHFHFLRSTKYTV